MAFGIDKIIQPVDASKEVWITFQVGVKRLTSIFDISFKTLLKCPGSRDFLKESFNSSIVSLEIMSIL